MMTTDRYTPPTFLFLLAVLTNCLPGSSFAQDGFSGSRPSSLDRTIQDVVVAKNCELRTINSVDVAARVDGILNELNFEEGDEVAQGDVLARVDAKAAEMMLNLKEAEYKEALINAANEVNKLDAEASAKLAEAEYESFKELFKEQAIPYWEKEKKKLEANRQRLRIRLADIEKRVSEVRMIAKRSEMKMAEHELDKHAIDAPVTGTVERRIGQLGQWVQAGTPIAQVLQMDRLRVAGSLEVPDGSAVVRKGSPVLITVMQGQRETQVEGKLGYVSLNVDVQGRNDIWCDIENRRVDGDWLLKPGMQATIEILP